MLKGEEEEREERKKRGSLEDEAEFVKARMRFVERKEGKEKAFLEGGLSSKDALVTHN